MENAGKKREMGNKAHEAIPGNPSTATSSKKKLNDRSKGQSLELLSEADWKHWIEEGYVILKGAIPLSRARKTADLIWAFEEKDPSDPTTWYAPPTGGNADEGTGGDRNGRALQPSVLMG